MTKADRNKRGRPRKPGPRDQEGTLVRSNTRAEREAVMLAVVEARCRAAGVWPAPIFRAWGEPVDAYAARMQARIAMIRAAMAYVSLPWMGDNAGRAIAGERDVSELWQTILLIRARHAAYMRAIDAPGERGILGMMATSDGVDEMIRSAVVEYDTRDERERADAAIAAWERLGISRIVTDIVLGDCAPNGYPLAAALRMIRARAES